MTRDEILEAIRAHLADELELDPARIDESTHFKRDLEADSLDLYTLVQELEDTYGVAMTDEQAARIQTVGAAVDFVLDNIDRPDAGRPGQDAGPDALRGNPIDAPPTRP
jgi:acyl carrier protein